MSQHTQSQAFTRAAALRRGAATTLLLGGAGSLIDTLAAQAAPAAAPQLPGYPLKLKTPFTSPAVPTFAPASYFSEVDSV
jgi:hypothetical protein